MTDKTTGEMEQVDPGMSVVPEAGLEDVPTIIPELDSALAAVPSKLPAYVTTTWKNKPSTATPVTAEVMTRVEQRLVDLTNAVNALQDSVSHAPFFEPGNIQSIRFQIYKEGGTGYFQAGVTDPSGSNRTINISTWKI